MRAGAAPLARSRARVISLPLSLLGVTVAVALTKWQRFVLTDRSLAFVNAPGKLQRNTYRLMPHLYAQKSGAPGPPQEKEEDWLPPLPELPSLDNWSPKAAKEPAAEKKDPLPPLPALPSLENWSPKGDAEPPYEAEEDWLPPLPELPSMENWSPQGAQLPPQKKEDEDWLPPLPELPSLENWSPKVGATSSKSLLTPLPSIPELLAEKAPPRQEMTSLPPLPGLGLPRSGGGFRSRAGAKMAPPYSSEFARVTEVPDRPKPTLRLGPASQLMWKYPLGTEKRKLWYLMEAASVFDGPRPLTWEEANIEYLPVGQTIRGVVEETRSYGAFIGLAVRGPRALYVENREELPSWFQGLWTEDSSIRGFCEASEMGVEETWPMVGDQVAVKILRIDLDRKRVYVSTTKAEPVWKSPVTRLKGAEAAPSQPQTVALPWS